MRALLCLVLTVSAVTLISCQTVVKDPARCSPYVNRSSLFTNENSSFNEIILGFQELTWQPFEIQTYSPCVSLTGTTSTQLFVQVETLTDDLLCIEIGEVTSCGSGKLELCTDSVVTSGGIEYVYFTCQTSCSTSGVPFQYRIIQSASESSGNLEYWCANIPSEPNDKYPNDVLIDQVGGTAISYSMTFEQTQATRTSGSVLLSSLSLILALLVSLLLM